MRIDCLIIPCARREFVQLRVLLLGAVASLALAAVWLLVALLARFSLIEGVAAQGNAVLVDVLMIGLFSLLGIFSLAEYLRCDVPLPGAVPPRARRIAGDPVLRGV